MTPSLAPVVLTLSGHDPCGGAGIQADIEAVAAAGCHATSVITCNTIQNTHDVEKLLPVTPELFQAQAQAVISDLPVSVIKIGLIGDASICREIVKLLQANPDIQAVLDPVLAAGGGTRLAGQELLESIRQELLPHITLSTPNSVEAREISGQESLEKSAHEILGLGCSNLLITGAHEDGNLVTNTLYQASTDEILAWDWERLPDSYHGSGCTLAASIAARLALGMTIPDAVARAQEYTWHSLNQARKYGSGQALPNRLYDCD